MASKKKFYAVLRGKEPGIYTRWLGSEGAQAQVAGFPGARFKGFEHKEDAEAFMEGREGILPLFEGGRKARAPGSAKEGEPALDFSLYDIFVYSDGGAIGNPGPGGYGTVLIREDGRLEEFSGGFSLTTNNRMELMGAIVGLEAIRGSEASVLLTSDSRYLVQGIEKKWALGWRSRGWKKSDGNPAMNPDLWERLLDLLQGMTVRFQWVKGHSGHRENERCDALAQAASRSEDLPPDKGYFKPL